MAYLAEANLRGGDVSRESVVIYSDALHDLGPDELLLAAREHVAESPFYPAPADLRDRVFDRRLGLPTAVQALEQVGEWLATGARPHPLVERARRVIGGSWDWRRSEHPGIMRRDFEALYGRLRAEELLSASRSSLALPGREEAAGALSQAPPRELGQESDAAGAVSAEEGAARARELAERIGRSVTLNEEKK